MTPISTYLTEAIELRKNGFKWSEMAEYFAIDYRSVTALRELVMETMDAER